MREAAATLRRRRSVPRGGKELSLNVTTKFVAALFSKRKGGIAESSCQISLRLKMGKKGGIRISRRFQWTHRVLHHIHRKKTQAAVAWSCLPFIRSGQNHFARHSERGKKTRQTEEEVGRQHQGMDRPGGRQSQRAVENRGKWRKLVAKSSVLPQRPSRLRDR